MSLYSTLITGARTLKAFESAIRTTTHNISNVNTPGYSRQRSNLSTVQPDQTERLLFGRGVQVESIERLRLGFLDTQFRQELGGLGQSESLQTAYQLMEATFQEPSEFGLSESLNKFWDAWAELTNDPTDLAVRANLRGQSQNLTSTFNRLSNELDDLRKTLNENITSELNHLNSLASRLDELNKQIKSFVFAGQNPLDLFDERDLILDELSKKVNLSIVNIGNGQVNVHIEGTMLVDATGHHEIEFVPRQGDPLGLVDIQWKETQLPVSILSGRLKGLLDARDLHVQDYSNRVNTLATGIMSQINTLHRQGMGLDGGTKVVGALPFTGTLSANASFSLNGQNISLFAGDDLVSIVGRINAETGTTGIQASIENSRLVLSPDPTNPQTVQITGDPDGIMVTLGIKGDFFSGTNASDIRLSDAIVNNLSFIAASQTGAPGDNNNAVVISQLRDTLTLQNNSVSFNHFYSLLVTDLGSETQAADHTRINQERLLDQLENMKESVSGVSLEEETTDLIRFQTAYEMAAKVIQTADEMLERLLAIA